MMPLWSEYHNISRLSGYLRISYIQSIATNLWNYSLVECKRKRMVLNPTETRHIFYIVSPKLYYMYLHK